MAYTKKESPGIMLYWSAFDALEEMVDGEAKQMLRAMRMYAQYGEMPDFNGNPSMKMAWCFMKDQIDRDKGRYDQIREKNAANGQKGGTRSGEIRRSKAPKPGDESASRWGLG